MTVAITYATEIAVGGDPERVELHHEGMWEHLMQQKAVHTFFKSLEQDYLARSIRSLHEIQLYCTCCMPETYDGKMICCNVWFHYCCSDLLYSKNPARWIACDQDD